jgi:predicted CXXCH cytochrome family protein
MEGCGACHEAHGSANPRMLSRAEVRFQCLECHSNITRPGSANSFAGGIPPAFHDLRNPRYRNCTICHVKIHGSHVNRTFLR